MKSQEVIKSIQYLRGLAALMVVFYHFRHYLNDVYVEKGLGDLLFDQGAFGVDLFFIISGFIICYSTRRQEAHPLIAYALKRIFRIYPLLIVSVLVFYFLLGSHGFSLARSLIPLHADYSDEGPFFGYNMLVPAWTLTYEISFYLLFLLGLAASHRHRKFFTAGLIVLSFVLLQLWLNGRIELSAYENYGFMGNWLERAALAILSSPMILEFVYGIALYSLYTALPQIPERARRGLGLILLGVASVSVLGYFSSNFNGHGPTNWGLPSLLLTLSLLLYERINGLPDFKWLFFLGNISYALYLTHLVVLKAIGAYHMNFGLEGIPAFAFAVGVSIAVATLVHYLIEARFMDACRRLLDGWIRPRGRGAAYLAR
jgi:peptidoglycan/LPS O-acetylase OafA/YrhL